MVTGGNSAILYGDKGADTLTGNNDADELFGGGGADTLNGGAGSDKLTGGLGKDNLVIGETAAANVAANLEASLRCMCCAHRVHACMHAHTHA